MVYRYGKSALIFDYKGLFGDVAESPANLQLRDYAVLVRGHFGSMHEVAVCIIQPRVSRNPELCLYREADLDRAAAEMFARIVRSNDPRSPRVAGEVQCKFCRARAVCSEFAKWSASMLPVVAEHREQAALFSVAMAQWTPDQWALAADILTPAAARLIEIKDALKDRLQKDPASVPGWMLAPGVKRETITDPQQVWDRFQQMGGTLDKYMACLTVGKTALKEALHELTSEKGKSLDKVLQALTKGLVEVKTSAPQLRKKEDA